MTDDLDFRDSDYAARLALVDRIAVGMATKNGDPILAEAQIIAESTGPTFGWASAELEHRTPVAIDEEGKEYFTHVRDDGRSQIEIESPFGTTTTIKFWLPDGYLPEIRQPDNPIVVPAPPLGIITTDENCILGSLLRELRDYAAYRTEASEEEESSHFSKRMEMLYGDWIKANHRKLVRKKPRYILNGWCSFSLIILKIEHAKGNLKGSPFSLHARLIDNALPLSAALVSHELENVRKFKKALFRVMRVKGLTQTEIKTKAEVIKHQLHTTGTLTEISCMEFDPDLNSAVFSRRAGEFVAEFRRVLGIRNDLTADPSSSGWFRFWHSLTAFVSRCALPASGIAGMLLCAWFLWRNWQDADSSPALASFMVLVALSPVVSLSMHYRKYRIERWCGRVSGGKCLEGLLHLLAVLGALVTFMGAIALVLGTLGLSFLVLMEAVTLIRFWVSS
jgi:hypothetical protein